MERELILENGTLTVCRLDGLTPDSGAVLECALRLTGVLPGRRIAVAVTVTERDEAGREFPRGTRVLAVPPHSGGEPRDVEAEPLRFFLPGELDVSGGGRRRITVRAGAHYIDGGERCLLHE